MGVRTRVGIAVLVLLSVVGVTLVYLHEGGGRRRPGDSVELPQTGRPVVPTGRFRLIGGLSSSLNKRCVYFQPLVDPQSFENPPVIAVKWPEGFEGRIAPNGDFWVLNARGRVVAREGDIMGLAGRFAHRSADEECLQAGRIFEVTDVATHMYFAE
jgi:hypothetical protein